MTTQPLQRRPFWDKLVLPAATLLFLALLWLLYPAYRYNIDPDGVAYLTIAQRYAAGDWARAVNGLWSPLHPFLASLLIRAGAAPIPAAHLTDAVAACGVLTALRLLLNRANVRPGYQAVVLLSFVVPLVYYHYLQLFADLWLLFLVMIYLWLLSEPRFAQRPLLWIATGLVAGVAVYAKAYALYFITAHLVAVAILLHKPGGWRSTAAAATVWLVMLLLNVPWAMAIHNKYGLWRFNTAGRLNTTWYLSLGGREFRKDLNILVPPPYPDSPTDWEDPWWTRGPAHSAFESRAYTKRQLSIVAYNTGLFVSGCSEISPFVLAALLLAAGGRIARRRAAGNNAELAGGYGLVLLSAVLILPLGYLLVAVESRYLGLLGVVSLVLGARQLQSLESRIQRGLCLAGLVVFCASFWVRPVVGLQELAGRGKEQRTAAAALKALGLEGRSFATNNPHLESRRLTAYFAHMRYYESRPDVPAPWPALLRELRRYGVELYLDYSFADAKAGQPLFVDEQGQPLPELGNRTEQGFRVFRLR